MIAIPVSLIATLAVMEAVGFSLNMLSLLGMVLAIGLVVDDAIVVVENVERQLEAGLAPMAAARKAMSEVTGPIIATTAVLMAVFVPVAFIPGVSGRLYNQFALTVAISVGISAFNSLTLSPALAAAFLRHRRRVTFPPFRWFNRGFEWLSHGYANAVSQFIRHRWILLGVFVVGLGAVFALSRAFPRPSCRSRTRAISSSSSRAPTALRSSAPMRRRRRCATCSKRRRASRSPASSAGSIFSPTPRSRIRPSNSPFSSPGISAGRRRTLRASCRGALQAARIPEAFVLSFDPPSIQGLGTTGGFEFEVEDLAGRGSVALNDATQALIGEARKQPELNPQQLFTTFSTSTPQFKYDLDRTKAKLLGLNLPDVFNTLQIYLGSLYVNDFNLFGRTFRVTLQADKNARASASDLSRFYVRNASGGMAPLSTLGTAAADRRTRDRAALQQLRLGPDQRRRRRRATVRVRRWRRCSGSPRRRCRATSATNGPASPIRS